MCAATTLTHVIYLCGPPDHSPVEKSIHGNWTCEAAIQLWRRPVLGARLQNLQSRLGQPVGNLSRLGPSLWRKPSALPFGTGLGRRSEVAERSAPIRITHMVRQFRLWANGGGQAVHGCHGLNRCRPPPRKLYGLPTAPLPHPAPSLSAAPQERLYCLQSLSRRQWSSHL